MLNKSKSAEIIFFQNTRIKNTCKTISTIPGINRVEEINILGVILADCFTMNSHINEVCSSAAKSLYAIKLMKSHGMDIVSTTDVFHATVISRLMYCCPTWWGFTTADQRKRLQAVVNRAFKWGLISPSDLTLEQLVQRRENRIF